MADRLARSWWAPFDNYLLSTIDKVHVNRGRLSRFQNILYTYQEVYLRRNQITILTTFENAKKQHIENAKRHLNRAGVAMQKVRSVYDSHLNVANIK
jgi:hypothetical protein